MKVKPLYRNGDRILVGLYDDFSEVCVIDGLVVTVDLKKRKVLHQPWSGQKILKKEDYKPILKHQKDEYRQKIRKAFKKRKLAEIEKQLANPPRDAINSLIWKPGRLSEEQP